MEEKPKNSFQKHHYDLRSKTLAEEDTRANSQMPQIEAKNAEIYKHNIALQNEYEEGEIGIDRHVMDHRFDERVANPNKLKKDLRAYVNSFKVEDP